MMTLLIAASVRPEYCTCITPAPRLSPSPAKHNNAHAHALVHSHTPKACYSLEMVALRPEEGPPVSVNLVNANISRKALAYLKAHPRVRKAGGGIQLEADDEVRGPASLEQASQHDEQSLVASSCSHTLSCFSWKQRP